MAISMLKIRRPLGRRIFNMGIAIPGKTVFLIETAPRLFIKDVLPTSLIRREIHFCDLATGYVGLLTLWKSGWTNFRALDVQDKSKMIQGTFLATLARLFRVPLIRRDRDLISRIVSCLSSASAIAVSCAISSYCALRYTGTDCMEF